MDVREKSFVLKKNYASTASGSAAGSSAGASIAGSGPAAAGSSAGYVKEVNFLPQSYYTLTNSDANPYLNRLQTYKDFCITVIITIIFVLSFGEIIAVLFFV